MPVSLIPAERLWQKGEIVCTPYGIAKVIQFDPIFDMYKIEIDWRPLDVQVNCQDYKIKHHTEQQQQPVSSLVSKVVSIQYAESSACSNSLPEEVKVKSFTSKGTFTSPNNICSDNSVASDVTEDCFTSLGQSSVTAPSQAETYVDKVIQRSPSVQEIEIHLEKKYVFATVHRSYISKYTPPVLPLCYHQSDNTRSILSFFSSVDSVRQKEKQLFSVGDKVTTPYGYAIVKKPSKNNIVTVHFSRWNATGYLHKDCVHKNKGIFGNFFSNTNKKQTIKKFPFVHGTKIKTPFGDGVISRPLPQTNDNLRNFGCIGDTTNNPSSIIDQQINNTIGISLTSWLLANDSNPILYCTPHVAQEWINAKGEKSNIIYSVLSRLQSAITPSKTKVGRITSNSKKVPVAPKEETLSKDKYERFFKDGTATCSSFGNCTVQTFRELDGFYKVVFSNWNAVAYLRKDFLTNQVAKGCKEGGGQPVLTVYGITGIFESIEPSTGIHIVTATSPDTVLYLQPDAISKPLKAAVGDTVSTTLYGKGIVRKYRLVDDIYEIQLFWGAYIYANVTHFIRCSRAELQSNTDYSNGRTH